MNIREHWLHDLSRKICGFFRFSSTEESSSREPKKGSQRPFLLVSAKPICIHYNKKWKARAPSEKFERAPRLINFLWILYYLRRLYLPWLSLHPLASVLLFPHPLTTLLSLRHVDREKDFSTFPLPIWRAKTKIRDIREVHRSSPKYLLSYCIYLSLSNMSFCTRTPFIRYRIHFTVTSWSNWKTRLIIKPSRFNGGPMSLVSA